MTVRNLVQISYGVPAVLSYLLVYWAIIAIRKQLASSFIFIYSLMMFWNIIAWLNSWVYLKLVNEQPTFYFYYDWLRGLPQLVDILHFLVSHFNYIQNMYLLFLTFDRFAAILSVTKNLRWWEKYYKHIIFVTHVVVLAAHLLIRLPMEISVQLNPVTWQYALVRNATANARNATDANVRLSFGIAITLACTILNVLAMLRLRKLKTNKTKSILKSFLKINICIFITQFLNVLVATLIAVFTALQMADAIAVAYEIIAYFSDVYSLAPALYTILLPGPIRQFLIRKFKKALRITENDGTQSISNVHHPTKMLVRNIIQLSYGIPGIFCYCLVFWSMFVLRKQLSTSFMVIFTLMAISNILTWVNAWIYLKLNNEPFFFFYYHWLSEQPFLINAQNFLVSHFNYVQNLDLLLLTIDRHYAIASISKNITWWNNCYIFVIIAAHFVILAAHLAIRLPMANILIVNSASGTVQFTRAGSDTFRNALDANVRLIFGVIVLLACLTLNVMSFRILRRLKVTLKTSIQRSFFFISFCIFVTQAMNVFISCLIAFFNTMAPNFNGALMETYQITFYLSDLFSLGPAIYTILMPGLVRQFLFRKVKEVLRLNSDTVSQISSSVESK